VQKVQTEHGFGAQYRENRPGLFTTACENGGARTRAAGAKGIVAQYARGGDIRSIPSLSVK